jgi:hypothetical protein
LAFCPGSIKLTGKERAAVDQEEANGLSADDSVVDRQPPLRIFINYRRSDASGYERALYDRLAPRFGAENVFFDRVNIEPGRKWLGELRVHGSQAGAFLVLVGPRWASIMRERAGSAEDIVRLEIEDALRKGSGMQLFPVLVGDATLPEKHDVPIPVLPVLARQAVELRPGRWDLDVEELMSTLERVRTAPPPPPSPPPPPPLTPVPDAPEADAVAPRPDRSHYDDVVRMMVDYDSVVPFLGPGANSSDRDEPWRDVNCGDLPDADELAAVLAEKLKLPPGSDLAQVSQYQWLEGEGDLYGLLRRSLHKRCPPSSVHRFLAEFPGTLHRLGLAERYQLIVTTNYDDALERAFEEAEEPYDLAVYMASGPDSGTFVHHPYDGKFVKADYDGEPRPIHDTNVYKDFPIDPFGELRRTIIAKIHGAVDGARGRYAWRNNYVITEDDYIDYLPIPDAVVPSQLLAKLRDAHLLFLGYTMRDWNLRVFLQRIFGRSVPNGSWAIQRRPDQVDAEFWRNARVKLFGIPLANYVAEFEAYVSAVKATV